MERIGKVVCVCS